MLKFVELTQKSLCYDSESETCKSFSSLKEIYVNPNYIISMRENENLKQQSKQGALVEGMDKNLSFTELVIYNPVGRLGTINVIGRPSDFVEEWKKYQR